MSSTLALPLTIWDDLLARQDAAVREAESSRAAQSGSGGRTQGKGRRKIAASATLTGDTSSADQEQEQGSGSGSGKGKGRDKGKGKVTPKVVLKLSPTASQTKGNHTGTGGKPVLGHSISRANSKLQVNVAAAKSKSDTLKQSTIPYSYLSAPSTSVHEIAPSQAKLLPAIKDELEVRHGFGKIPEDIQSELERVAETIRSARRVVVISGAGISTPAIPDFRSATGLFKTIAEEAKKEERKRQQALARQTHSRVRAGTVRARSSQPSRQTRSQTEPSETSRQSSDISGIGIKSGKDLFDVKCLTSPNLLAHHHSLLNRLTALAADAEPSPFHKLLKSLDEDGRLLRVYTQNIDGLEAKAGLDCRVPEPRDWTTANKRRRITPPPPYPSSQDSVSVTSEMTRTLSQDPPPAYEDRTRSVSPALPRCIPLHGMLETLDCTRCSYSIPLESFGELPATVIECPACVQERELRITMEQRPRSVGLLRASVVLYGEEHKHGEAIGSVVEKDLSERTKRERPDLLIVAGTTLQIPGVKRMIKEFAKVLRSQPAKKGKKGESEHPIRTILLNRDPPSRGKAGEWADVFDVWIQGNLQDFVKHYVDAPTQKLQEIRDIGNAERSKAHATSFAFSDAKPDKKRKRDTPKAVTEVDTDVSSSPTKAKLTLTLSNRPIQSSLPAPIPQAKKQVKLSQVFVASKASPVLARDASIIKDKLDPTPRPARVPKPEPPAAVGTRKSLRIVTRLLDSASDEVPEVVESISPKVVVYPASQSTVSSQTRGESPLTDLSDDGSTLGSPTKTKPFLYSLRD